MISKSRAVVALNMDIEPELKERVQVLAAHEHRSMGGFIRNLLLARVEGRLTVVDRENSGHGCHQAPPAAN
jgi:hypothetical protein